MSKAKAECASLTVRNTKRKEVQQGKGLTVPTCHFLRSQGIGDKESNFQ